MINSIIEKVIPSETVKRYIRDNDIRISFEELVSLIYNSELTLKEKIKLLEGLQIAERLKEYNCDNPEYITSQVRIIRYSMKAIDEFVHGFSREKIIQFSAVSENGEDETRCAMSLSCLKNLVKNNVVKLASYNIQIINLITSDKIADVTLNTELDPVAYSGEYEDAELQNLYVNIALPLEIGDIVRIYGDESETDYVVCSTNDMPKNLDKELDYFDSSITVIPKSVLNSNENYKEQINKIIANRIKHLDEEIKELDLISVYHEHISIVYIEKV